MTQWLLWGTLVNAAAVLVGALIGVFIKWLGMAKKPVDKDEDLPHRSRIERGKRISDIVMVGLGLCAFLLGVSGGLKVKNILVAIVSMALGGLLGELLDLDRQIGRFGSWIEKRVGGSDGSIAQGFVTSTLIFCVGAMTVTGAMESGTQRVHDTYYAKSVLDLVAAIVFGSAYGFGVLLSALAVLVFQGTLTLLSVLLAGAIQAVIIEEVIAVGSLLLVCIGLNQMGATRIRVMNLLPGMFFPILLVPLFELLPI